jgi:hypothetical protein
MKDTVGVQREVESLSFQLTLSSLPEGFSQVMVEQQIQELYGAFMLDTDHAVTVVESNDAEAASRRRASEGLIYSVGGAPHQPKPVRQALLTPRSSDSTRSFCCGR